jgi:tetratricopeptide (TPR) repeat protein
MQRETPLPPPATIRRGIKASVALLVTGLLMTIVPDLRMPGVALAIVFGGLAAMGWRNLQRAERRIDTPGTISVPPMADGAAMFEVLAMLEVPLDMGTTDPQSALLSGAAKAGLYHAYTQLMAGEESAAMPTLARLASGNNGRVSAAAHYLLGKAHERNGRRQPAMAAYRAALEVAPDYALAQVALTGSENA